LSSQLEIRFVVLQDQIEFMMFSMMIKFIAVLEAIKTQPNVTTDHTDNINIQMMKDYKREELRGAMQSKDI
jgi:hypothetical protein